MHGHYQNGRVTSLVLLVFDRNRRDKPDDHANLLPKKKQIFEGSTNPVYNPACDLYKRKFYSFPRKSLENNLQQLKIEKTVSKSSFILPDLTTMKTLHPLTIIFIFG